MIKNLYIIVTTVLAFLIVVFIPTIRAYAITSDAYQSIVGDSEYYNPDQCSGSNSSSSSTATAPGTGTPTGLTFPDLNPTAMANAINTWIQQQNSSSELNGLGTTIVASAQHSNISPFLVVAIAQAESSLASPSDPNTAEGNNAFGRRASSNQPNFVGGNGSLWYKWPSVEASVDYTNPANQNAAGGGDIMSYIRDEYPTQIDSNDLSGFLSSYGETMANQTNAISQMASLAQSGDTSSTSTTPTSSTSSSGSESCCGTSTSSSVNLVGSNNTQQAFNYFVSQGLSGAQSAGIVGNLEQESSVTPTEIQGGGNTNDPSSLGDVGWGIAQWTPASSILSYASQYNITGPIYELATQLQVLWAEMTGDGYVTGIKQETTPQTAADYFEQNFERAGDAALSVRENFATQILQQYGSSAASSGSSASTTSASGSGSSCNSASSSGYENPLRDVQDMVSQRIDQGVDYDGVGPVYALGNGTYVGNYLNFFEGQDDIIYHLTSGPAAGQNVYIAECVTTTSADVAGAQVTSNTVIAQMNTQTCPQQDGIEIGWANTNESILPNTMANNGPGEDCYQDDSTQYPDGLSTTFGVNFNQLLQSLGEKTLGILHTPVTCSLPSNWPNWTGSS